MNDLYTVQISVQQRIGRDVKVRIYSSIGNSADTDRREDFELSVVQDEEPDDLRDWLRMALAALCEAI